MSYAPTEAHYEQKVFERPWMLLQHHYAEPWREPYVCWRQLEIGPYGRPDLLIFHRRGLTVVELKRDVIDQRVVGQVLRYMGIALWALETEERLSQYHKAVDGVLVAPRIKCDALWSSCCESTAEETHYPQIYDRINNGAFGLRLPLHIRFYRIDQSGNARLEDSAFYPIGTDPRTAEFRDAASTAAGQVWNNLRAEPWMQRV